MAIKTVKVQFVGTEHTLTYNATTQKYEKTITAPVITSYNVNSEHYYPVTVEVEDTAGNKTTVDDKHATLGASLKLRVIEKEVPTVTISSPGAGAYIINNKPNITFQLRDQSYGSGVDKTTLSLKINGTTNISWNSTGMTLTPVGSGFDGTYIVQTALPEGANDIQISVKDFDGNIATAFTRNFTVDTLPPVLDVYSPANGFITNVNEVEVTGNTNDTTSSPARLTIKLNNKDTYDVQVGPDGNFSTLIPLTVGLNTLLIRSEDGVGKFSEITRTLTLDITPPVITSIELVPNPVDEGATLVLKVTATDA